MTDLLKDLVYSLPDIIDIPNEDWTDQKKEQKLNGDQQAAQDQRGAGGAERAGTKIPLHHVLVGAVTGHRHEGPGHAT